MTSNHPFRDVPPKVRVRPIADLRLLCEASQMKLQRALLSLTWKATLGGIAACLATIFASLAGMVLMGGNAAEIAKKVGVLAHEAVSYEKPHVPLLTQPVLETFLFLVGFKLLEAMRITRRPTIAVLALAFIMGIVGWLLHDARGFMVAQAFGFAVLGALFAALRFQSGSIIAFAGTALAHMLSNASILALALIYAPRIVWESRVKHAVSGGTRTEIVGYFEIPDQCRRTGVAHLQRLQARQNAQQRAQVTSRITCERAIRSGWSPRSR